MKRAAVLTAALLAACGGVHERPTGPPVAAVAARQAGSLLENLRLDVEALQRDDFSAGISGQQLLVELPAAAVFEEGNAQLKLEAMQPLARLAADIGARGGCVVHVIGVAADAGALDLAERRAATIAEDLARRAVPAARVRRESREHGGDERIVLVVRPVVIGAEAQAWMSPTLDE